MPVFVFQFKVKPETGHHHTVKHAYAGVYVRADDLAAADSRAREYVSTRHWTISAVVTNGFAYNPALHDLPDEAALLCHRAQETGAAMGVAAVGFDPEGEGPKS